MTTPEAIEVKFAVAPSHTSSALAQFAPLAVAPMEDYTVHFFDLKPLALSRCGVILRVREGAKEDATFKMRGGGAKAAFETFGVGSGERKFEGDQNVGSDVKQSFSITSEPPLAKVADVLAGAVRISAMFEPDAGRFLEMPSMLGAAGEPGVYGPIEARKWKVKLKGFDGKLTVEWWKAGEVQLLEVSDKVATGEAEAFAAALGAHMQALGLPQLVGSKTEFALGNAAFRVLVQPGLT